ncbi:hypothetical protein GCM10007159_24360 [Modicisalibacter luteus]|nr:hypothetical protein GCM10007159_24360 [Halomonas lutea]
MLPDVQRETTGAISSGVRAARVEAQTTPDTNWPLSAQAPHPTKEQLAGFQSDPVKALRHRQ